MLLPRAWQNMIVREKFKINISAEELEGHFDSSTKKASFKVHNFFA